MEKMKLKKSDVFSCTNCIKLFSPVLKDFKKVGRKKGEYKLVCPHCSYENMLHGILIEEA